MTRKEFDRQMSKISEEKIKIIQEYINTNAPIHLKGKIVEVTIPFAAPFKCKLIDFQVGRLRNDIDLIVKKVNQNGTLSKNVTHIWENYDIKELPTEE